MRKIAMFSRTADCVGGCPAPPAKVGAAKPVDGYSNRDRVSRATAFANYARSPRALAPAGAPAPVAPSLVRAEGVSPSEVAVHFTPPPGAAAAILSYLAVATPGGASAAGLASPITVGGLESDTEYWFTVRVLRADGSIAVSAVSNVVTTDIAAFSFSPNTIFGLQAPKW